MAAKHWTRQKGPAFITVHVSRETHQYTYHLRIMRVQQYFPTRRNILQTTELISRTSEYFTLAKRDRDASTWCFSFPSSRRTGSAVDMERLCYSSMVRACMGTCKIDHTSYEMRLWLSNIVDHACDYLRHTSWCLWMEAYHLETPHRVSL